MRHLSLVTLTALALTAGAQAQSLTVTLWTLTRPEANVNLDGTWTLSGGTALRPVAGRPPSLTLAGGRLSGTGGCNQLSGAFRLEGGRLTVGPLASTRMLCGPEVNTQESAFLAFLAAPLTAQVQALTLTLTNTAGQTLVFRRAGLQGAAGLREGGLGAAQARPRPSAADGRYTLARVDGQLAPRASQPVTLVLEAGRIGGSDGCNSFGGTYRLEGGRVVLTGRLVSTLMACPDPDGEVNLTGVLRARPTLTLTPAGLTLTADGTALEFRRASSTPTR